MPLKDVDLKTFEAYKKAIRQDLPKVYVRKREILDLPRRRTAQRFRQKAEDRILYRLGGPSCGQAHSRGKETGLHGPVRDGGWQSRFRRGKRASPLQVAEEERAVPAGQNGACSLQTLRNADAEGDGEAAEMRDCGNRRVLRRSGTDGPDLPRRTSTGAGLAATWNKLVKDVQRQWPRIPHVKKRSPRLRQAFRT